MVAVEQSSPARDARRLAPVTVQVTEKESVLVETGLVFEPVKEWIESEPVEPVVMKMRRNEPGRV